MRQTKETRTWKVAGDRWVEAKAVAYKRGAHGENQKQKEYSVWGCAKNIHES